MIICVNLSLAFVSVCVCAGIILLCLWHVCMTYSVCERERMRIGSYVMKVHSCHSSHFFFLSRPHSRRWIHLGNSWLPWLVCLLWMWLSSDSHLAFIVSPSPSVVDATHQYKWLMMLFCHFATSSHCFCLASASTFLRSPAGIYAFTCIRLIIINFHTYCNMPDVKVMLDLWMCFSHPLGKLFVPIHH